MESHFRQGTGQLARVMRDGMPAVARDLAFNVDMIGTLAKNLDDGYKSMRQGDGFQMGERQTAPQLSKPSTGNAETDKFADVTGLAASMLVPGPEVFRAIDKAATVGQWGKKIAGQVDEARKLRVVPEGFSTAIDKTKPPVMVDKKYQVYGETDFSKPDTINKNDYIVSRDEKSGRLLHNIGMIDEEKAAKFKMPVGGVRLKIGEHFDDGGGWGYRHIVEKHKGDIANAGYGSVMDFVDDVLTNFNDAVIDKEGYGPIKLKRGYSHGAYVSIRLVREEDHYSVTTVMPARSGYLNKKKELSQVESTSSTPPADVEGRLSNQSNEVGGLTPSRARGLNSSSDPNIPPSGQNSNAAPLFANGNLYIHPDGVQNNNCTMADQTAAALELGAKRGWTKEQLREANRLMRNAEVNKRQVHFEDAGDGNLYLFAHGGPNKNFAKWKITPDGSNYQFRWTKPRERIGKEEQEMPLPAGKSVQVPRLGLSPERLAVYNEAKSQGPAGIARTMVATGQEIMDQLPNVSRNVEAGMQGVGQIMRGDIRQGAGQLAGVMRDGMSAVARDVAFNVDMIGTLAKNLDDGYKSMRQGDGFQMGERQHILPPQMVGRQTAPQLPKPSTGNAETDKFADVTGLAASMLVPGAEALGAIDKVATVGQEDCGSGG